VATIPVQRSKGLYGGVQVNWTLTPGDNLDLRPSQGFVTFTSDQATAYISLQSVPDDVSLACPPDIYGFSKNIRCMSHLGFICVFQIHVKLCDYNITLENLQMKRLN